MGTGNRFCPECGIKDVEPLNRSTNFPGGGLGDVNKWECNSCGHIG